MRVLQSIVFCLFVVAICTNTFAADKIELQFDGPDRPWVGAELWANRIQDWHVADGRLESVQSGRVYPNRTVHLLIGQLADHEGSFSMSVETGVIGDVDRAAPRAMTGFLVGAGEGKIDYRGAALIQYKPGPGGGYLAAARPDGTVFFGDFADRSFSPDGKKLSPDGAIDRTCWRVVYADSQEVNQSASNVLDGKSGTIWHTEYIKRRVVHPHEIVIDMGKTQTVRGIAILPRQPEFVGRITEFDCYIGDEKSPADWGEPTFSGTFDNKPNLQRRMFSKPATGRYLRLVAKGAYENRPCTTLAELFALDVDVDTADEQMQPGKPLNQFTLQLTAEPSTDVSSYTLTLVSTSPEGEEISRATCKIPAERLVGNVALMVNYGTPDPVRFWFDDWTIEGDKLAVDEDRAFGPIAMTQYTLSGGRLKMTAQLLPLGANDTKTARLEILDGDAWKTVDQVDIIEPGFTAPFVVDKWDTTRDLPFRVVYDQRVSADSDRTSPFYWSGTIRKDPVDKEEIVVLGITCIHHCSHGLLGGRSGGAMSGNWLGALWFPHADMTVNMARQNADVAFFAGDQVYEGNNPTYADGENLIDDYLYKWYLFCWAFGDLVRDIPAVTIPDDHDVYQGNLWGHGGGQVPIDTMGGYTHTMDFVRMVERTQTSHFPDPYDPSLLKGDLKSYYTAMIYGRVGFAVLEDRKFKTGPYGRFPDLKLARPDHIVDPDMDPERVDDPSFLLLGRKQLEFIDLFAADWAGQDMKLAMSQTPFAALATHHGGGYMQLVGDMDSGGWPHSARDRAIRALRRGFIPQLAGDQHLSTVAQHGVDEYRDGNWSFTLPAGANYYPRSWEPSKPGGNRNPGDPEYLGDFTDAFGNLLTMRAVANPGLRTGKLCGVEPSALHDLAAGYGTVRMNKKTQEITLECWPRYVDPNDPSTGSQYEGWPIKIHQGDNYGRHPAAFLPVIDLADIERPTVQIIDEKTGEIVYTLRVIKKSFRPHVFDAKSTYTVKITDDGKPVKTLEGVKPTE